MARRGENIYKRRDGRWEARYRMMDDMGTVKYGYLYAPSYREVKAKLQQLMYIQKPVPEKSDSMTFKQLLALWMEKVKMTAKLSTYTIYERLIATHMSAQLGYIALRDIDHICIQAFLQQKLQSGRLDKHGGLSVKTVRTMSSIIHASLHYGFKQGYMKEVQLHIALPKSIQKEVLIMSKQQQEILETDLWKDTTLDKLGIMICLYTGIRLGEICGLKWSDICFETRTMRIRRTMQRIKNMEPAAVSKTIVVLDRPKSISSKRFIPLQPSVYGLLISMRPTEDDCFLLTGCKDKHMEPRCFHNYFKRRLVVNGLRDINFHALRHTFATRCVEVGLDAKSLSEILGHMNVNITLNLYVHANDEAKRNKMEEIVGGMRHKN